ncbi:MAG TPA: tetratricopeptide repeat protein [Myxococcaceae bacterium]|nr:tetratricopeptide repeat protein [Myxococcaceae bacterium]
MKRVVLLGAAMAVVTLVGVAGCRRDPPDHLRQARMAIFEKDPQRALKLYKQAIDELEETREAQVIRARALKGAADVYHFELGDIRQAIAVYRELITQCPESPEALEAHLVLADLLRENLHDLRGAITELTAAIARNPPQSAELIYRVAKLYFELNDFQQSELEAQKVVTRYETSTYVDDAMLLRGQALAMMENKAEAMRSFEDLSRRFPDSELAPYALVEMGRIKAESGENEKAIEIWVEALKNHPQPAVVQTSIARARRWLANTTPTHIGEKTAAFDDRNRARAKNSVEAVGGSSEEASRDFGD